METVKGVHQIPSRMSRMYLIVDESLTLIDAGLPWDARTVFRYVESIGRKPEEIDRILLTHNHPDYTSGAHSISKRTGAEIVAHEDDTRHHHSKGRYLGYMGIFNAIDLPVPFLRRATVSHTAAWGCLADRRWHTGDSYARPHTRQRLFPLEGQGGDLQRGHRLQ